MPAVSRKGDQCTGHGSHPPRASTSGSSNVFVNNISAHRQGDTWAVHCDSTPECHDSITASGSGSVYVNGQPLARIGDDVACGSAIAQGSETVFSG